MVLRRGHQVLPLPPKAFETLLLVRNSGHLMKKENLMAALWPDSFVEEVSLASKISLLRKVLEEAGAGGAYIQTVPKQGYRFLPAVTRTWASGPAAATPIQAGEQTPIEVQNSLVRGIVELLMLRLTERERRVLAHNVPRSARAYEFYLRANHVQRQRTFENMSMARNLYRKCLDEDPDYAPAWARLGRCYRFLEKFGQEEPQSLELAKWAFHRAFALSPDLPIAHNLYTQIEADSAHAQEALVRLLGQAERHPNDPELFGGLVQGCRYCGLLEESIRAHHRARGLDPRIVTSVAHTFFLLGDYPSTLAWYPPGALFYLDLAVLAVSGRVAEAADLLRQRGSPGGQFPAMIESLRLSLQGDHARSVEIVRQALAGRRAWDDPETTFYLARQLARDGAHADALRTMRDLVTEGFFCSTALQCDPWLRPLSHLPDFKSVLDLVLGRWAEARAAFEAAGEQEVLS